MKWWPITLLLMGFVLPGSAAEKGIVSIPSNNTVQQTGDRPKQILQTKGVTLFALIDHSG